MSDRLPKQDLPTDRYRRNGDIRLPSWALPLILGVGGAGLGGGVVSIGGGNTKNLEAKLDAVLVTVTKLDARMEAFEKAGFEQRIRDLEKIAAENAIRIAALEKEKPR